MAVFEIAVRRRNMDDARPLLEAHKIVSDKTPGVREIRFLRHMSVEKPLVVQPDELLGRDCLDDRVCPLVEGRTE